MTDLDSRVGELPNGRLIKIESIAIHLRSNFGCWHPGSTSYASPWMHDPYVALVALAAAIRLQNGELL